MVHVSRRHRHEVICRQPSLDLDGKKIITQAHGSSLSLERGRSMECDAPDAPRQKSAAVGSDFLFSQ